MRSKNERGNAVTSTSTAVQSRVVLYQPSQRPTLRTGEWMETSYGRCRVTGRLGQRHADVLEAIMYCAEKTRTVSDGGVELLVDPAQIRKTLSDSRYSFKQIEKLIVDLRVATITIEVPKFDFPIIGGLIDHVIPSAMTRPNPLNGRAGTRALWRVRLGVAYVTLLKGDVKVYYDPTPIARLECGISQAVARHVLSHKVGPKGGWYVDTLIVAVAGEISGQAMRDARRYLQGDEGGLREMGIILEGDRIKRGVAQPPDDEDGERALPA